MLGMYEDANARDPQQEDRIVHPQLPPGAGGDHVCAVFASATEEYLDKFTIFSATTPR